MHVATNRAAEATYLVGAWGKEAHEAAATYEASVERQRRDLRNLYFARAFRPDVFPRYAPDTGYRIQLPYGSTGPRG